MPVLFVAVGLGLGWLYFFIMQYSVSRLTEERGNVLQFMLFVLLRMAVFALGVVAALQFSGWCLITLVLGFIAARTLVVRRVKAANKAETRGTEGSND